MDKIQNKYTIRIPNNVKIFYSKKKNIIIFQGLLKKKSLELKTQLFISKKERLVKVSSFATNIISNSENKNVKAIQGTTTAIIKQFLVETSTISYKRLKIVGVGYKAFNVEGFKNNLLLLKLGYSHSLYFKTPKELSMFCLKLTKLFIYGNSYSHVTQTAALLRSKKAPEPYKGKGIRYETENITLKEGKKN